MRKTLCIAAAAAALAAVGASAQAAYLESDYSGEEPVIRPVPRPIPRPEPPVRAENEVRRLISRVSVGGPYHYRGLAVYPLYVRGPSTRSYLSLDEALSRGLLVISEYDDATVRRLYARNRSRQPVFIMQGEGLAGGRQNRVVSQDVLLAPGAASYVPVYCMEERRWAGGREVDSAKMLAPEAVRRKAAGGASQREVWGDVERALGSAGARSETKDLSAALKSPAARGHVSGYLEYFRRVPRRGLAGVAVARWGRLTSIDIFESEHLARSHWDKIISSSGFELLPYRRHLRWPGFPGASEVRRMLTAAYNGRMSRGSAPGSGEGMSIFGTGVSGSACLWRGEAVHVSLWGPAVALRPMPVPLPRPVPYYRGSPEEERF